ncbi:MAG: beta-lactamase family protein [Cyclobacteriaceae bacterium]
MRISEIILVLTSVLALSCKTEKKETFEKFQFALPEEVGMSSDSLANIESMVMEFVETKKFPGAVTLIAKDGKIIYESEIGWADSAQTVPYRKNHLFRMASMTKPVVSVAAMQLIEAGKIKLNDPVSKYIPSFDSMEIITDFNHEDTTWKEIPSKIQPTINHLLNHTSGIPYAFENHGEAIYVKYDIPAFNTYRNWTIANTMSLLGTLPLAHEPGEKWTYGLSTDVLGRVIEVASGMELDNYVRENITLPIGANTLDFYFNDSNATANLTPLFIADYKTSSEGQFVPFRLPDHPLYDVNYPVSGSKTYFSGGTGMTGTARDYFLFCQVMLNDGKLGHSRILKPETAQIMHQNQIDTISYPWGPHVFGYGFSVATSDHPNTPIGTYGWGGTYSTDFWIDPKNRLIVIQLRQVAFSGNKDDITSRLEKIVYSAFVKS